jgi:hypothetical protein
MISLFFVKNWIPFWSYRKYINFLPVRFYQKIVTLNFFPQGMPDFLLKIGGFVYVVT